MGHLLLSGLDDATIARLNIIARERKTSAEALARHAINDVAKPSADEKLSIVARMYAITNHARVPGVVQTPAVDLFAPTLIHAEVANAIWKKRRGEYVNDVELLTYPNCSPR